MTKNVLVLGARGRFGHAAATAFEAAGWQVHRFDRARDDLMACAAQADVVVNGWNPPNYSTWHRDLLPLHARVIEACKAAGTPVLVPGNVYVFGAHTPSPWSEHSSHATAHPLGVLRRRMEEMYRASGVRVILLRCGDFLDTRKSGNWFDLVIAKGIAKGRLTYPGALDVPHAWAYLPDAARAAVALADMRDQLPAYCDVPFEGYTLSGAQMCDALSAAMGRSLTMKTMSWWPRQILQHVMPSLVGLTEMRYLWRTPHRLDGTRMGVLLPDFKPTQVLDALARSAAPMGSVAAQQIDPNKAMAAGL